MEIISYSYDNDIRILGGLQQRTKGKKYRLNKFCLKIEVEEGTLIRNYLTGAIVMLKPVELMNIYTEDPCDYVDFLVNHWFLVPEQYDEEEMLRIMRESKIVPITDTYLDHPEHFTILTTTTCNARCFYCYELKSKGKTPMSIETAEKVAKYIIGCAPKDRAVNLDWFGGEPLYNHEVIDLITSRVRSAGFEVHGTMVSNGYLFDEKMVKKAKNDWNLQNVQITLDGTEEIYNKSKNYIYKDTNPFKVVIGNMHNLLKNNISISVRMNCDKHNFEDLIKLVEFLHEEFKEPNISYYVWPIFEEGFTRTPEERNALYDAMENVEQKLREFGYSSGHNSIGEVKGIHCMIDKGNAICIFPRGEIGICEHYLDSKFVSHIDNPNEKNWDVIKGWRKYEEFTEICETCPIKPGCLRAIGCTDTGVCFPRKQKFNIDHDKRAIIDMYKAYMISLENGNQGNCQGNCEMGNNDCPEHSPDCMEHYPTKQGNWQRIMSDGTIIPIKSYQNGN